MFAIDRVSEGVLVERFAEIAREWPCLLIAEGLGADGRRILPAGIDPGAVEIAVIVDPIDGTRGLMYQKRPAWILTGVAAIAGRDLARDARRVPRLSDITLAVQTEIPLVKQHLCDQLWAIAGGGAHAERCDRLSGARTPLALRPSAATTMLQGFGGLSRFFPGGREELSAIDDAISLRAARAAARRRRAVVRGSVHLVGRPALRAHRRATIAGSPTCARSSMRPMRRRGQTIGVCSHPYDLCHRAHRAGGRRHRHRPARGRLDAPLDVFSDVGWVGYANATLRDQIAPLLAEILRNAA